MRRFHGKVEFIGSNDQLNLRFANGVTGNRFIQRLEANEPFCTRISEVILKLVVLEHRAAEDCDVSHFPCSVQADQKLRDVLEIQGYAVTMGQPSTFDSSR